MSIVLAASGTLLTAFGAGCVAGWLAYRRKHRTWMRLEVATLNRLHAIRERTHDAWDADRRTQS